MLSRNLTTLQDNDMTTTIVYKKRVQLYRSSWNAG